jgi:hypothetical protein
MDLQDIQAILAAAEAGAEKYTGKQDRVTWSGWKGDGTEMGKWSSSACYARGMNCLSELEIHCLPYQGASKTQMPALWYHHFFRLLKRSGLVPPEVRTLHRNGAHCLIIPRTGWDRHSIYITLCYYRQCDQKPLEIVRAMLLWKRLAPHGTHLLQVLHYLAVTTKFGSVHYFMNYGAYGGAGKLDLSNGMALAWFAGLGKKERRRLARADPDRGYDGAYTNVMLAKKAKNLESVKVTELVGILDPKYAKYYAVSQGGKKK